MLLDTCALLWLSHDQSRIGDSTRAMIERAPVVSISSVTAFEVGLKYRSGKLKLPMPPRRWLDTILSHHRIAVIGLDLDIGLAATELPPIHKDPCDRFIIATALTRDLPVVTSDARFSAYGVRVLA